MGQNEGNRALNKFLSPQILKSAQGLRETYSSPEDQVTIAMTYLS
jgi:hypothetical protein